MEFEPRNDLFYLQQPEEFFSGQCGIFQYAVERTLFEHSVHGDDNPGSANWLEMLDELQVATFLTHFLPSVSLEGSHQRNTRNLRQFPHIKFALVQDLRTAACFDRESRGKVQDQHLQDKAR
ncbi:MAG: hypothetical protein UY16_C0014G0003 [Candidatus Gottesmanbacteria bacterium GW2011_GWA2_47_9]|uniref:Uncharacterized protein n=1 Tax=Candidatus Gottesmanbacteria bacterium GW2011_GWA2_47_9 TaxID=1618445 RepID=A0A0G1WCK7_9BACT|nr:MAG: hypothetical protein UY16_C0014G0003 [Candidatus Gottesmanbacteria bacterium GW2011_GWA2_47_9]